VIPCGITSNTQTAPQRIQQGFKILTVGGDGLSAGTVEGLRAARAAVK